MQEKRSYRLASIITSMLFAVIGLCISISFYAARLIWPDQDMIYAELNSSAEQSRLWVLQNDARPPVSNSSERPNTSETTNGLAAHVAPAATVHLVQPFTPIDGISTNVVGKPIFEKPQLSISASLFPAEVHKPLWLDNIIVAKAPPTPMEWPQRVDPEAVLAVSSSIGSPLIGWGEIGLQSIGPPPRITKPAEAIAPYIRISSMPDALSILPPPQTMVASTTSTTVTEAAQLPSQPVAHSKISMPAVEQAPTIPLGDGKRISVVGVFQTNTAAWALLELGDGRIVKATKGTVMEDFKVSRIRDDKIWIRMGGSEKGLTTGQIFLTN